MLKLSKIVIYILYLLFLFYLVLPNPDYPNQLPDTLQSNEPGDMESTFRRAYFTDYTRNEIITFYYNTFRTVKGVPLNLPTFILNYPPEDAQTLVRDQTRSTYLQEIVHPLRESIYVNGFEPTEDKDKIVVSGTHWLNKVTVKMVESDLYIRIIVGLFVIVSFQLLVNEMRHLCNDVKITVKTILK